MQLFVEWKGSVFIFIGLSCNHELFLLISFNHEMSVWYFFLQIIVFFDGIIELLLQLIKELKVHHVVAPGWFFYDMHVLICRDGHIILSQ